MLEYSYMVAAKKLRRSLGLPLVALYGLGNILGAGIYVLVGKVAGEAGYSTVLAFLVAMVIAGLTAFSYMELSGRYPASASVSVYLHKAFGRRWLSVSIGLAMVAAGITSAATLAKGFAGYLNVLVPAPEILAAIGLLALLGLIAARGIGESATLAGVFTLIEIAGLALVIFAGRSSLVAFDVSKLLTIDPAVGLSGIVGGAFLAFYAFIGFEDMVNVAEETKRPERTMPLAILISLIVSTILYLLVATVAITTVSPAELAQSNAPLSLVYARETGGSAWFLTIIGISAAVNGVIVQIIMGSRVLYGLSRQGWLDSRLATVDTKTKTPVLATTVVVGLMAIGVAFLPLVSLARLTSLIVLSIFALVNASLIVIKRQHKQHEGAITVPVLIPYLGALSAALVILYELRGIL
jgi:amino acid transporter